MKPGVLKTHCIKGHPLTPMTVYLSIDKGRKKRGLKRTCCECQKKWSRDYQRRKALELVQAP